MSVTFAENSLWWHDLINVKKPIKVDPFQSVISGPEKRTRLSNLGKEEINRINLQNAGCRISLDNSHVKSSNTSPKSCIANKYMQGKDLSQTLELQANSKPRTGGGICVGMISLTEQLHRK